MDILEIRLTFSLCSSIYHGITEGRGGEGGGGFHGFSRFPRVFILKSFCGYTFCKLKHYINSAFCCGLIETCDIEVPTKSTKNEPP